jgi:hypothetical protein
MSIYFKDISEISHLNVYKVHLANWNGSAQPLDVFVRDKNEWKNWNTWKGAKNDFNRDFIFSLIDFYHEPNIWLFGGIYKVLSRSDEQYSHSYQVELTDKLEPMIGRLKIYFERPGRAKTIKLEKYFDKFRVSEILKNVYAGEVFCGYENINHEFHQIENIFIQAKNDWKTALENIKGIYVITDKSNGKKYVGSAYGDFGIWSRWSNYIKTGYGGNEELKEIIDKNGIEYARKNFVISLLEYRSMKTDDRVILDREKYWKKVFLSQGRFGYNKN